MNRLSDQQKQACKKVTISSIIILINNLGILNQISNDENEHSIIVFKKLIINLLLMINNTISIYPYFFSFMNIFTILLTILY